jgi:hypothetical protein
MQYIEVGGQLHVPAALSHRKEVLISVVYETVKDLRTGLDALEKLISSLCRESKLDAMLTERCYRPLCPVIQFQELILRSSGHRRNFGGEQRGNQPSSIFFSA